jgi:predicted nucleic acid-binding protein
MEYKYIVDTCVWVALFNRDDSCHERALENINLLKQVSIVPDFILAETATVLKLKSHINIANSFLEHVRNSELSIISFSEMQDDFSLEFMKEDNDKLSYIDSSLLAMHKTGKYKIITFDENLLKLMKKKK